MELRANEAALRHRAPHCNSGNFTYHSCTAISIQGSFFPLSPPMDLSLMVTYGPSPVSHRFCCPYRPQATEARQGSNPPQETRHDQREGQGWLVECTFFSCPKLPVRSCGHL